MTIRSIRRTGSASVVALLAAGAAIAQSEPDRGVSYTLYGTPGLIEMPSAVSANDGVLAGTVGYFDGQLRTNFTFQVTPRLSGTFRYTKIDGFSLVGAGVDNYFDRSFDLRYRLSDEQGMWPSIAVGLQDFLGTGAYGAEYVVATKTFGDSVRVSAGLGWGRFGSYGGFSNLLGLDRDSRDFGEGGTVAFEQLFRGDIAPFGGIEYAPTDKLTFKAEYSSDAYERETELGLIDRDSPFNFGVVYRPAPGFQLGASYLYGSEFALTGSIVLDPKDRPFGPGLDSAPVPVSVRQGDARAAQSWNRETLPDAEIGIALQKALLAEGVELSSIQLTDRSVRLRYTNTRYRAEAQAMGRIARMLSVGLPPSIELFVLEPMQEGIPLSAVTLKRSDIEAFENEAGGTAAIAERLDLADAGPKTGLLSLPRADDRFSWNIAPYFGLTFFNPDSPVELTTGLELNAEYEITPSLVVAGTLQQRLYTTFDGRPGVNVAQGNEPFAVRTNSGVYSDRGTTALTKLTVAHYARPGQNLYSRTTVGYLERMYGGISSELLWKPVDSALGLGAEINYVQQREFDGGFGFQDYDVVTGHASAYYTFGNNFYGQVDVGRYLAGDWGATFTLDREFENGWSVGGYFTLTEVPFEDYGEGSFDKGIRLTIPLDYVVGQPTRQEVSTSLNSLTRDGGARLEVDGRLYDVVRDGHLNDLSDGVGRFWR